MEELFNHVKRLRVHSSGSQEPGKGFKQLKFHHLKEKNWSSYTKIRKKSEKLGNEHTGLGKQIGNLLTDNVGALQGPFGSPPPHFLCF